MTPHVLVLAAGKSTRIASVAGGLPKPLMRVGGRSILAHTLGWLAGSGIEEAWINLHYQPDTIRHALGDGAAFGVRINYSFEDTILGTAGAFRQLAPHWSRTTLVVYGDNLMRFDLGAFLDAHLSRALPGSVALFDPDMHPNTRIAGGRVAVDEIGRVAGFTECGTGSAAARERYVNAGAYLLEPSVVAAVASGFQDFARDVFPGMVQRGELAGHVIEPTGYCLGLDTPESLRIANSLIESNQVVLT